MAKPEEILKTVMQIEKAIRHNGMWGNPYIPPPQIPMREEWADDIRISAEALNKVFFIRCLPVCSRLFGQVQESRISAFFEDYTTPSERVNYARNQVNLLIADLKLVRGLDLCSVSRISD